MKQKTLDPAATHGDTAREQFHGDLRKGAYLKRRAEYQMQASAPGLPQAGTVAGPRRTRHTGQHTD